MHATRHEALGDAEPLQRVDHQGGEIAARARAQCQRLRRRLHTRLHTLFCTLLASETRPDALGHALSRLTCLAVGRAVDEGLRRLAHPIARFFEAGNERGVRGQALAEAKGRRTKTDFVSSFQVGEYGPRGLAVDRRLQRASQSFNSSACSSSSASMSSSRRRVVGSLSPMRSIIWR